MLHFRTILLWLAFMLLLLQYFIDFRYNINLGIAFRLAPSALLILWFILSLFFKENLKISPEETPKSVLTLLNLLRPLASICIILGAIFKLTALPNGNIMLLAGIGFMALYSSLLSVFAFEKNQKYDDILDDLED